MKIFSALAISIGMVVAFLGVILLFIFGQDYATCHQWWVDPNQPACAAATVYHSGGLFMVIVGSMLFVAGLITSSRS